MLNLFIKGEKIANLNVFICFRLCAPTSAHRRSYGIIFTKTNSKKINIIWFVLFVQPYPYICFMKLRNILIAGAIFGVGYYLYKKKSLGNNARFSFDAIKLSGTNIIVTVGILNAVSSTATLKSMVGDLIVNGNIIATGSLFDAVTIPPNTKTQFNITFVPSATGVLSTLKNIIKQGLKNIKAKFVGTANINGFNMPIDLTYGA